MNSSNHNQDQIDRYLTGSLEAEELKKFRESLNTDPVLAEEVKQQEILVGGSQSQPGTFSDAGPSYPAYSDC